MAENRSDPSSPADTSEAEKIIAETLQLALSCHETGRIADAEALYRSILEFQPRHAAANHHLGLLLMQTGKLEAALDFLTNACAVAPETGAHWVGVADCLMRLNRPQESIQVLETAIQAGLEHPAVAGLLKKAMAAGDAAVGQQLTEPPSAKPGTQHAPAYSLDETENQGKHPTASIARVASPGAAGATIAELNALVNASRQAASLRRKAKHKPDPMPALLEHMRTGDWQTLEAAAKEALRQNTTLGKVWDLLGIAYLQMEQHEAARIALVEASKLTPKDAEIWDHLGIALQALEKYPEAESCYERSLTLNPDRPETWTNMGNLQQLQGNSAAAIVSQRRALARKPDFVAALTNLSNSYHDQGKLDAAMKSCLRALELQPNFAEAHNNLANCLRDLGQYDEAIAHYRRAMELKPTFSEPHAGLANCLSCLEEFEAAIPICRRAVDLKPNLAHAHTNLGIALKQMGQIEDAVQCFHTALAIKPDCATTQCALGDALRDMRQVSAAMACYRKALALKPDFTMAHSHLLFGLSHDETTDAKTVFSEHRAFGERVESPFKSKWIQHTNLADPDRKLRVGFVSADLFNHAVATFVEPVWRRLDSKQIEIWVYANCNRNDAASQRLKALSHQWRVVIGMGDQALADQIQADQIDILCDLSGHTSGHRLPVFARKPAPIQTSWIGYPNTTGLTAMDYYLADRFLAPPGLLDGFFTEKIVRLPCSATFQPSEHSPEVNTLPALEKGVLTFGSFNRSSKLGDRVIGLWSQVMNAIPGSRLILAGISNKTLDVQLATALAARFAKHGITADRLSFHPRLGIDAYLALHHGVDLVLDTFPYGGGTTALHAAWMGVPTLTLAGTTLPSRQGATLNAHLGLTEFVTESDEEFVAQALKCSQDLPELAAIRSSLRERMLASALTRPETVARGLEHAFRTMWRRWCQGLPTESFEVTA